MCFLYLPVFVSFCIIESIRISSSTGPLLAFQTSFVHLSFLPLLYQKLQLISLHFFRKISFLIVLNYVPSLIIFYELRSGVEWVYFVVGFVFADNLILQAWPQTYCFESLSLLTIIIFSIKRRSAFSDNKSILHFQHSQTFKISVVAHLVILFLKFNLKGIV